MTGGVRPQGDGYSAFDNLRVDWEEADRLRQERRLRRVVGVLMLAVIAAGLFLWWVAR